MPVRKQPAAFRLDREVMERFRRHARRQTRIDAILRAEMERERHSEG